MVQHSMPLKIYFRKFLVLTKFGDMNTCKRDGSMFGYENVGATG